MNDSEKRLLVDELVRLATEDTTAPWSARLYLAAALQLEAELEPDGDDRTLLTVACERVKAKGTPKPPQHFPGFVQAWLGEAMKDTNV